MRIYAERPEWTEFATGKASWSIQKKKQKILIISQFKFHWNLWLISLDFCCLLPKNVSPLSRDPTIVCNSLTHFLRDSQDAPNVFLANVFVWKKFPQNSRINWLVVSTPLKNISQNGNLPQVGVKIKNIWNHYLVNQWSVWNFTSKTWQKALHAAASY